MAKRTLMDTAKDPLARESFIKGKGKRQSVSDIDRAMVNTRIPKDTIKRMKRYCVEQELTIQEFITQAVQEKLKAEGF